MGYLEHMVAMEEISRASASVGLSLWRAFQPLRQPDPPERHPGAEGPLPAEAGVGRVSSALSRCRSRGRAPDVVSMRSRAEKRGDRYILNGTKMWITNGPRRRCDGGLRQDRPGGGVQGHHCLPGREGDEGLLGGAEARQARHARQPHGRAGLRHCRGAGGERAGPARRRRARADERPGLRARGAGGRPAGDHAGLHGRGGALCPRAHPSSASRSASSS